MEFTTFPGNNDNVNFMVYANRQTGSSANSASPLNVAGAYFGSASLSSLTFSVSSGSVTGTVKLYQYN
jgi:hypothetical protein